MHHFEALADVPYRRIINVPCRVKERERINSMTVRYPARLQGDFKAHFNRIIPRLQIHGGSYFARTLGPLTLTGVSLRQLGEVTGAALEEDPHFFVNGRVI